MSTGSVLQNESNQEKTLLEKEQRVWTMTKKIKKNYLLQKMKEAKEILTAKSKEGKALSRNCRAIVMVCM